MKSESGFSLALASQPFRRYIPGGFLIVPPHFQYRNEEKAPTMQERLSLASSVEDNMEGEMINQHYLQELATKGLHIGLLLTTN